MLLCAIIGIMPNTKANLKDVHAEGCIPQSAFTVTFTYDGIFGIGLDLAESFKPIVFTSIEELKEFQSGIVTAFKNSLAHMEHAEEKAAAVNAFTQLVQEYYATYDDTYFSTKYVVIAWVGSGSSRLTYNLHHAQLKDGVLNLSVIKDTPMIMTMDYRQWFMVLEVDNDYKAHTAIVMVD